MLLRSALIGLAFLGLAAQTGCNCLRCWPCGHNYCGSQCGDCYWSEWFSLPPDCCDPCTNCGAFCGPNNRFLRRGVFAAHGGAIGPYADAGFTPGMADPRAAEEVPRGQAVPRAEELPAADMPDTSQYDGYRDREFDDDGFYNELGQQVSYQRPVDSPRRSRTLGRPPRSRLKAR
jgi:hypothetical protein